MVENSNISQQKSSSIGISRTSAPYGNCDPASLELYAVTDRGCLQNASLEDAVGAALRGGVTFVQLREKSCDQVEEERLARALQALCAQESQRRGVHIPFVINDHVELARAINADGVHVGQDDCSCRVARELLGPHAIVGVSVATYEQACRAMEDGADYLGVGALYKTATKPEAADVTREELVKICSLPIPVVGIGGLNETTIPDLAHTGVDGAAVVSAVFAAQDVEAAARRLRDLLDDTDFAV